MNTTRTLFTALSLVALSSLALTTPPSTAHADEIVLNANLLSNPNYTGPLTGAKLFFLDASGALIDTVPVANTSASNGKFVVSFDMNSGDFTNLLNQAYSIDFYSFEQSDAYDLSTVDPKTSSLLLNNAPNSKGAIWNNELDDEPAW